MKKKNFLLLGIFVALLTFIGSMQAQQAKDYFNFDERGEAYFSFKVPDRAVLQELALIMSIDEFDPVTNEAIAYASEEEFEAFLRYGLKPTFLTPPSMQRAVEMFDYRSGEKYEWNAYPTYEAYISMMEEFQTKYPSLCTTSVIGKSVENRKLMICKLTSSANTGKKPRVLYTSTMHGDETTGYVVLLRLIDHLLSNYESDPRIKNILDKTEVWICPLTNPDGAYRTGNHTVQGATRYNANNVDLNRNFKDDEAGDHPDGKPWQPEATAFMDLEGNTSFVLGANIHGGTEVVNYPWDNKKERHADDEWYKLISRNYAAACQSISPGYMTSETNSGIINGSDWYVIRGSRQDNANYFHRLREITLEISNTKLVPASQLPKYWNLNKESLLALIEESLYGIHGTVTSAANGQPLKCQILIENHDKRNSDVYSDATTGYYVRPIKAGTYTVKYKAEGYPEATRTITIKDKETVIMDIALGNSVPLPVPDFTASPMTISVGESVQFQDQTTNNPTNWEWTFEGGQPAMSTEQNPLVSYSHPGQYDVTLKVWNASGSNTITKEKFITVNAVMPVAEFVGTPTEIEEGQTVSFQNQSTNATNYVWIFDGGTPATSEDENPTVLYSKAGQYDVTLKAISASGETVKTKEKYITVKKAPVPAPVADFEGTPRKVKKGETVTFKDLSTNNPTSWLWVFEGGSPATSTEQNPVVTYNETGKYDVQLTATNEGGSNVKKAEDYIEVILDDSVEDIVAQTGIVIRPQNGTKQILIEANAPIKAIVLYDINGRVVLKTTPNQLRSTVDLSILPEGIYTINIKTEKSARTEKIHIG